MCESKYLEQIFCSSCFSNAGNLQLNMFCHQSGKSRLSLLDLKDHRRSSGDGVNFLLILEESLLLRVLSMWKQNDLLDLKNHYFSVISLFFMLMIIGTYLHCQISCHFSAEFLF